MLSRNLTLLPYKMGSRVFYHTYPSEEGDVILFVNEQGICALHFCVEPEEAHVGMVAKKLRVEPMHAPFWVDPWWQRLQEEFAEVVVALCGTPFQLRVWKALCTIPEGETRSYCSIARQLGMEKGARAVARACAQNLVACLVPCHRVTCGDGKISGYRWGVERKRGLLRREGVRMLL